MAFISLQITANTPQIRSVHVARISDLDYHYTANKYNNIRGRFLNYFIIYII